MVGVIGYEVRGVVVLAGVWRGPQCTLDRRQKPFVVACRLQQIVQNLLVRLALLEDVVLGTYESSKSEGECEDTEDGEDEGTGEGGERQREDGREAATTTRTPPKHHPTHSMSS